ncbi:AAA family ATPase [Microbacterium sp. HJ5]
MDASPPPTPVVLLCGAAGAGKTTYSRALEATGFVRLSYDDEMWALGRTSTDASLEVLAEADRRVRHAMVTSITAGAAVVLDASLSTRAVRDELRALVVAAGGAPRLVGRRRAARGADRARRAPGRPHRSRRAPAGRGIPPALSRVVPVPGSRRAARARRDGVRTVTR